MTMGDLILVALALLIGTILALSGGCTMNIGAGSAGTSFDRHVDFEEPVLELNQGE